MSAAQNIKAINSILNPHLHQVIGSTPSGVKDSLKKAGIRGSPQTGVGLGALAVFAASVNKVTLENMASTAELSSARSAIINSISISGKTNMTALTLLGHALLTTAIAGEIDYAAHFRKKMGQNHLWAGDLESGRLSDQQKKIMKEKKENTNKADAMLLGSGFWKYVGVDPSPMTDEEATFWGETIQKTATQQRSPPRTTGPPQSTTRQRTTSSTQQLAPSPVAPENIQFTHPDGTTSTVDATALSYYLAVNNNNQEMASNSIKNRGEQQFSESYRLISERDPERKGTGGGSTVG